MRKWAKAVQKSLKEWLDLVYNVHSASKEYWSYDELMMTPIKDILKWVDYITPKMKEIIKRQEVERMKNEMLTPGQKRKAVLNQIYREK